MRFKHRLSLTLNKPNNSFKTSVSLHSLKRFCTRRLSVVLFSLLCTSTFASIESDEQAERVQKLGIKVIAWHDVPENEIEKIKEYLLCTPVSVVLPLSDSKQPEHTRLTATAVMTLDGRTFSFPTVSITKDDKNNIATVCMPLETEHQVDITYSFTAPEGAESFPLCPPSYLLKNIERYINKARQN